MRKDKAKNVDKVASTLLVEPLATQQEIADANDIWVGTVNRALKELEKTGIKDPRIHSLTEMDLQIIEKWLELIHDKMHDEEVMSKTKITDISTVIRENTARYTLMKWNMTDDKWALIPIEVTGKSLLELDEIRRQILSKKE